MEGDDIVSCVDGCLSQRDREELLSYQRDTAGAIRLHICIELAVDETGYEMHRMCRHSTALNGSQRMVVTRRALRGIERARVPLVVLQDPAKKNATINERPPIF